MRSTFSSKLRSWLLMAVAATLVACGNPANENTSQAPDAAQPDAAQPEAASTAPETSTPSAAEPAPATSATTDVQESAAPDNTGGGEQLKLVSANPPVGPTQWKFRENEHYTPLSTAQGITGAPGKIEVVEAFWYGCPHCYELDPTLDGWVKTLPADVSFVRLPVMWNPTNQIHARLYYTAQALGKIDEMHTAIFREMHVEKKMLTSEADIQAFFARFGVSETDFKKTFRSFAVEGQLKRAKDLTERYQVRSVPMLIVDGKYTTNAPGIRNYDDMLAVTSELIERERQR